MSDTLIYSKLSTLPDNLKHEVVDFIDFLIAKKEKESAPFEGPKFGCAKGQIMMSDDFDAPLEDFKEYME
ncbi:MAG: DUF2281 domain-containing protein [Ignavibacteriae bacterium]|nr:DUF2281 domain-containing protein [Ignavibacteriota bacterium]